MELETVNDESACNKNNYANACALTSHSDIPDCKLKLHFSCHIFYIHLQLLSDLNMVAPTVDLASLASRHQDNVYQYHFSATNCFHSLELNFVFGTPFSGKFADEMTPPNSNRTFSEEERDLSRLVMTLWSNFAKHG